MKGMLARSCMTCSTHCTELSIMAICPNRSAGCTANVVLPTEICRGLASWTTWHGQITIPFVWMAQVPSDFSGMIRESMIWKSGGGAPMKEVPESSKKTPMANNSSLTLRAASKAHHMFVTAGTQTSSPELYQVSFGGPRTRKEPTAVPVRNRLKLEMFARCRLLRTVTPVWLRPSNAMPRTPSATTDCMPVSWSGTKKPCDPRSTAPILMSSEMRRPSTVPWP
mmetsp:Transcript_48523/g.140580  ORF Transcript_48523/g.140580 Transcript_48523/m.140580 type:complete len:224 (+) Transcript_48523:431-1102(+)